MALFQFRLPDIGEGVTEGEVVTWLVKVGDQVLEDEAMVEVMTDKATVVIGAPKAGKIAELKAKVGDRIKVGDVLVVIETGNGARVPATGRSSALTAKATEINSGAAPVTRQAAAVENIPAASSVLSGGAEQSSPAPPGPALERPLATPAVRKLARELGIDIRDIKPSRPGNKLTREEVLAYAERRRAAAHVAVAPGEPPAVAGGEKRIPFVGIRRRIAERMEASRNTAVHSTFVEECEADRLMEAREKLRPEAEARGIDLTYLPFIVKAAIAALKKHPVMNARLDASTNELVLHDYYNIGIATATEQGLMVPVVHNAQKLNILQIAESIERLSAAAQKSRLSVADLNGSTFTVTSLGKLGGLFAIPLINLPNVAILGVHRIKQRPVARDDRIVIGRVMLLSLSFDHRIVDGQEAASFVYDLIDFIQEPSLLSD